MLTFDIIAPMTISYGLSNSDKIPWNIEKLNTYVNNLISKTPWPQQLNAVIVSDKYTLERIPNVINIIITEYTSSSSDTPHSLIDATVSPSNVYYVSSFDEALLVALTLEIENLFVLLSSDMNYDNIITHFALRSIYAIFLNHDYECDKYFPLDSIQLKFDSKSPEYYEFDSKINDTISFKIIKYSVTKTLDLNNNTNKTLDLSNIKNETLDNLSSDSE